MVHRDVLHGLRQLARSRGFTAAALACLSLGIGISTALYSVVQAVLLRPLPYGQPGQLARIYTEFPTFANGGLRRFWTSGPEFFELRQDLKSWQTIDAWTNRGINLTGTSEPVRANATYVSGTLLDTLGVQPVMGRRLQPGDDAFGAPLTLVISEGFWKRVFGGDPRILTRTVSINGEKANIVGVMPGSFQFPPGEIEASEVWLPLQLNPANPGNRGGHNYYLLGRLKAGVSLDQARQEMAAYISEKGKLGPGSHHFSVENHTLVTYPLQAEVTGSVRPALWALLGATAFVLLIACGNVANLLLARAEERGREIAVRRALGASTWELVRQFLAEGVLLSAGGAALGVLFAHFCLRMILRAAEGTIPRSAEIQMDWTVLVFACGLALLVGVFFGLAPLVQLLPRQSMEQLKAGTRSTATWEAHWMRNLMITGEMALALVLLIGAGLLMGAFWKLQRTEVGVRPRNVVTMRVALPNATYREPAQTQAFWRSLEERLRGIPGVQAASISSGLPPERPLNANDTVMEGFTPKPGGPGHNIDYWNIASPGYLAAQGIELLEGRWFNASDGAGSPFVVVVNDSIARIYYGGKSPLGRRVRPGGQDQFATIVGVVRDVRNAGLSQPVGTELYLPLHQVPVPIRTMSVSIRASGDPLALVSAVRNEVRGLDPTIPVSNIRTMEELIARSQARPRFLTLLLGLFSAVALGLAALGIYSVMSYAVTQRTSEFGIRMAMGAQREDVLRLVLTRGLTLAATGLVAGALGSMLLNRLLRGAMYGIGQFDPLPFAGMSLLLTAITVLACVAPALRATRVDPLIALRYE